MSLSRTRTAALSRRLVVGGLAAATVAGSLTLALPTAALAQGDGTAVHTKVVSATPASTTPAVKDGVVESVVQVGNTIVIGGTFTTLVKAGGTTTYTRTGLAAFDATTGAVSTTFNPVVNGEVTSLEVAADQQSVYIGGAFNTVNTVTRKKVAQVRISDGSLVTAFKATGISSGVADLRRVGSTLWIGGQFKTVASTSRVALATLNATTGALTNQSTLALAGLHNGGTTNVREIAVSPDQTKLIIIGNFLTVNGQPRDQAALIDISGATAALSGWQTNFFTSVCAKAFDTFMRDVAISNDGTYAVFTTTGAYKAGTSCDTVSRFEITGTSAGLTPTWINMTGGDTTTAVTIAGNVIYVGGHFRWSNNPSAGDRAGQGAVARTGLAALNPINGLPYPWNPTRERGYGVYDFLATPTGLWIGSDTDLIGDSLGADGNPGTDGVADGYHPRIAFMPLAGGTAIPADQPGTLPGDVLTVSPGASTSNTMTSTQVSSPATPGSSSPMTTSDSWANARGAMVVDNTLFTAWSDRLLYASPLNGSSVGARTQVNLGAAATCTTSSGSCAGAFSLDAPTITGMFYDAGRMYYTMSGSTSLYYRYFEPQGGVVGGTRFSATGGVSTLSPSRVRGMFYSGGQLYFADSTTGRLMSIGFSGGVVGSTVSTVEQSRDWRARGLALRSQPAANQAPTARITGGCTFLACSLGGGTSSDGDGTIASYAWSYGDGTNATGANPGTHTYATDGSYTVTLTVTDDDGAPATDTFTADVAGQPTSSVAYRASATVSTTGGTTAKVTIPASVQAGDALVMFVTLNADSVATAPAGWEQEASTADGTPDMRTQVFSRQAIAGDGGKAVSLTLSVGAKAAVSLLAYSGVDAAAITAAGAAEPGSTGAHAAPSISVGEAGSWVLSYWADKGATTPTWTLPGSVSRRSINLGTGGGQVGGVSADTTGAVPTGTFAGLTATSSVASGKATSFSVVLPPA